MKDWTYFDVATVRGVTVLRFHDSSSSMDDAEKLFAELLEVIEVREAESPGVVVNLDGVRFISSSILGAILGFRPILREQGGRMSICNAEPFVHEMLSILQVANSFPLFEDEDSAIEWCRPRQPTIVAPEDEPPDDDPVD